ncbi:MAG: class A beta-lactamase-related serine hydrolase [Anaerolineae bacterium]|nr:class A beta-lactamase-related serine hydrolase [Anaerolineae bacterium]
MTSSLSGLGTRRRRRQSFPILPILSALMLLAAVGMFVYELVGFSTRQDRLPAGVSVAGVDISGLTPSEAVAAWERTLSRPVTLWYEDSPMLLDPAAIGFRSNNAAMLAEARSANDAGAQNWIRFFNYLMGQEERSIVSVELSASYQNSLLDQFMQEVSRRYDRQPGQAGYDAQTLTIRPGPGGRQLDIRRALPLIDAALRDPVNRSVNLPLADTGASFITIDTLKDLIVSYLDSQGFIYDGQTTLASIYIMDLETGEEINLNGDVAVSAASTMKVPILIDYYRTLALAPTDEEAFLMANSLLCSNTSSSNLIMQIIGGGSDIFKGLADVDANTQYLGARNTFITAPFVIGTGDQQFGSIAAPRTAPNPNFNTRPDPYNQTTAEDLGTLFGMIYDCANYGSGLMAAYPDGEYTQNECRQMLELMSGNNLLRLLQGGIPPDTRISHKNGWLEDVHGDAGIVFPPNGRNYVIAVFVWEDTDFFSFTRAWPLIEGISRAAWNYFSPETPLLAPRGDLPQEGAAACDGPNGFLPPFGQVNLNDINAWRSQPTETSG